MSKQDHRSYIEERMGKGVKILSETDTFRFTCDTCGECCKNRNDIILSPYDIYRATQYLHITPQEFISKYGEPYVGEQSKLPLILLKFKTAGLIGEEYTVCHFRKKVDGRYLCSIHPAKPFVCLSFPLGRVTTFEKGKEQIDYMVPQINCGVTDERAEEHTLKSWFSHFDLSANESFAHEYNQLHRELTSVIDLQELHNNKRVRSEIKEMFYNVLFHIIYGEIPTKETDMADWTKNMKVKVIHKAEELVHVMALINVKLKAKGYKIKVDYLNELKLKAIQKEA